MHPLIVAELKKIPELFQPFVSKESLIDIVVKHLISQRVQNGIWTKEEKRDFDLLTMERYRLMAPPRFRHLIRTRRRRR